MKNYKLNNLKNWTKKAWDGNTRNNTNEPYSEHLFRVAKRMTKIHQKYGYEIGLLHDTIEDLRITSEDLFGILIKFGYDARESNYITDHVNRLTDFYTKDKYKDFNRMRRKQLECERYKGETFDIQNLKMCDILDNISGYKSYCIDEKSTKFYDAYIKEKQHFVSMMPFIRTDLILEFDNIVEEYRKFRLYDIKFQK